MPNRSSTRWKLPTITLLLGSVLFATGCEQVESIQSRFERRLTPHEQYTVSLEKAGLTATALGRSWIDASTMALAEASPVDLPFREARYLDPAQPEAVGYRFELRRGQQLLIDVATQPGDTARVFVDLYEAPRDPTRTPRRSTAGSVKSAESVTVSS